MEGANHSEPNECNEIMATDSKLVGKLIGEQHLMPPHILEGFDLAPT
jgi:hypothetical protein